MTNETKPAPATDGEVASKWAKEILGWSPRLKAATPGFIDAARGIMEKDARISADAETLRAKDEEIERLKGVIMGATGEARATLTANILRHWTVESMAALAAKISNDDCRAELSTLRAQVETLREALRTVASTLHEYAFVEEAHHMAEILRATEPKG